MIFTITCLFIILKCPYPEYLPKSFSWDAYLQNELLLVQSQFPYHDVLALQLIHLDDPDPEYYEDKFFALKVTGLPKQKENFFRGYKFCRFCHIRENQHYS